MSAGAVGGVAAALIPGSASWPVGPLTHQVHDEAWHEEAAGSEVALTLLGSWSLEVKGTKIPITSSAKRLIVLLALKGGQRRAYVAGTLWPDVPEKRALTRLRGLLWSLRRQCEHLLDSSEDSVALAPGVVVDVRRLLAVARRVIAGAVSEEELTEQLKILAEPAELLLGWYDDWVLVERDRINELRIRALECLAEQLLRSGRHGDASLAATAAIELDPLRESSHRALMRVYLAEGNPALAARQVERYRRILKSSLGREEPTAAMFELLGWPHGTHPSANGHSSLGAHPRAVASGDH